MPDHVANPELVGRSSLDTPGRAVVGRHAATATTCPPRHPEATPPSAGTRVRRPWPVKAVALVASLAVGAAVSLVLLGRPVEPPAQPPPAAPPQFVAAIDAPAVDAVAPGGAVMDVKEEFGARGDGVTDDTDAIQSAIAAGLGYASTRKILYFPSGVYLVSRPLEWRLPDGSWSTWLTLLGQNRDTTVIKLRDSAPGFDDSSQPQAVIVTASKNGEADGGGNQAHHNFIFDLTIDVGAGNPGANGVDYLANNRGAIRNVVVRAAPGSGQVGVAMSRRWPGPCLLQDVRVIGFNQGLRVGPWGYGVTAEHLRLSGQRESGIEVVDSVLQVRDLRSRNAVPAVRNGNPRNRDSLLTVVGATLEGEDPAAAAVQNDGQAFLRDVSTTGYRTPLRDRGIARYLPPGTEWTSSHPTTLGATGAASLRLPVREAPGLPVVPADRWTSAIAHGARPGDGMDDTAALQAALDSGAPVVHLTPGQFDVTRTLQVPPHVRAVVGFDASLSAVSGPFGDPGSTNAIFEVGGLTEDPLIVDQLSFVTTETAVGFRRASGRPLALRHIHLDGVAVSGTPGDLYLTDVEGGSAWRFQRGDRVWARQFNTEQRGTKVVNDGADLWVLGLKTESPGTAIMSSSGARTEVLGGLVYPAGPVAPGTPAFETVDATQSLTFLAGADREEHRHVPLVRSTDAAGTVEMTGDQGRKSGAAGTTAVLVTSGTSG